VNRILSIIAFSLFFVAWTSVSAQEVRFDTRAIVVNPNPRFGVSVSLDKPGATPVYAVGEEIRISVSVDRDAYVYLYSLQPDGSITQILPNRFSEDNFLRAGQTRSYPPQAAGYVFNVEAPTGLSKVLAVAATRQLDTRELARFEAGASFATSDLGQEGFQSAFRIVVRPIPTSTWVTATAYYQVERSGGSPRQSQATLAIDSQPRGADVYVDGSHRGVTPLRLSSQPGQRTVRIERSGYRTFETSVRLAPGESRRIDAALEPVRAVGTLRIESEPSGADVYLNGRYQGVTPLTARDLAPGEYLVDLERDGYRTENRSATVRAGESLTVRASLSPLLGTLVLRANVGGAEVFLDGRPAGTIPSGSGVLEIGSLAPAEVEVTVVAVGYTTEVTRVRIVSGEVREVRIQQTRR